jgi:hypothetical protein
VPYSLNSYMRYFEFAPTKPPTPQQSRLNSLKQRAEIAKQAVGAERKAQQIARAQQRIQKLNSIKPTV